MCSHQNIGFRPQPEELSQIKLITADEDERCRVNLDILRYSSAVYILLKLVPVWTVPSQQKRKANILTWSLYKRVSVCLCRHHTAGCARLGNVAQAWFFPGGPTKAPESVCFLLIWSVKLKCLSFYFHSHLSSKQVWMVLSVFSRYQPENMRPAHGHIHSPHKCNYLTWQKKRTCLGFKNATIISDAPAMPRV